jgi:two-component system response regulator AtoC
MTPISILVVDDEAHMRRVLEIMLGQLGHRVHAAADGQQALDLLSSAPIDLVLTDLRMPVLDGLGLLAAMAERGLAIPALVMTAHATVETAVRAMKSGAQDYLLRPFDIDVLELAITRVMQGRQLRLEHDFLRDEVERGRADFVGRSALMRAVFEQIGQVGPTRAAVFITGETGTGKELAARALHRASERSASLFVPINCAALPAEMIEAELFGHEKGAFTGAVKDRIGKFELASGGTIFLDEITEAPLALQAKLLRVLQEGCVERLGSNRSIALDLRVIAASNRDPREAVREGRLREDLYYRLNVFALALPPLRERPEDIPDLVRHCAARLKRRVEFSADAMAVLMAYAWPGNVRELDNVVQRALILGAGTRIEAVHLPADLQGGKAAASTSMSSSTPVALEAPAPPAESLDLASAVEALERRWIHEALRRTGDNKRRAAALLGISERTLWYKLERSRASPDGA